MKADLRNGRLWVATAMMLGFAAAAAGQQASPADVPTGRRADVSELAIDNNSRVAASAIDIKGVLLGNPGLMVEVKHLIANQASDKGQVLDDLDLTDSAVYERLESDLALRAAATTLLQRYGYLLPKVNPDSDAAKERDFVLQERARRIVQIETQEAGANKPQEPQRAERGNERQESCIPGQDSSCEEQTVRSRQPSRNPPQETNPQALPQDELSIPNQPPPTPGSPILKTGFGEPGPSGPGTLAEGLPILTNVSGVSGASASATQSAGASPQQNPSRLPQSELGIGPGFAEANVLPAANRDVVVRPAGSHPASFVPSVQMVRKPSPYSDVPSLYDLYVQASHAGPPQRFGAQVFRDGLRNPSAIPMDLPVGPDYVVGPGDVLSIDLWGGVSSRLVRSVDREGRVTLPEAGPLQVSGRSLGEVQQAVEKAIATQFRDTSADVSVSRLRTVRVYVVGEVSEPGAYDISSLSTALNALVAAGGVTPRGSLRDLKHYRGRQLIEDVDAYDLLLRGVKPDAKKLENGDTLMVPPVGPLVTITGMVRRPAIYELTKETTLAEALELAGGILPAAALKHVEVQRLEAHDKRTMLSLDLSADNGAPAELSTFKVQDGDEIHIFPIAPYNEDAVYLQGHVLRPGRYSYKQGMKLTDLIASYKDLLPEPAAHYAEIVRLNAPDFHPSVESFDLAAALANPAADPTLKPLDTVRIFSRFDFEPSPQVLVSGEVRAPGQYVTSGQAHVRDAVFLAGGLAPDASLTDAQLFRREADGSMKILNVDLRAALAGDPVNNIALEPRDRLLIHRNAERVEPATVDIRGEVANPGRYPFTTNMHAADLVRVAGGLKRSADTKTADLTRYPVGGQPGEHLEVSLSAVLNGNETEDIPLRNGDTLTVKQVPGWKDLGATVMLRGEVMHPGKYGIQPGERLSSVLERAGGYSPDAYPYGAVLMRTSVREVEERQHTELIRRVEAQQTNLHLLPETDQDQKNAKLNAIARTQATLEQLRTLQPVGRVVIHAQGPIKHWRDSSADIAMRDGDILVIPKKSGYVMVSGQVYNPTAVSYRGGRSAKWYLRQAGGLTQLADKKAVFVIRADGSVLSAKNNSSWWFGDPLSSQLRPGDTVVVPEKALNVGNRNIAALLQAAQVASSIAITAAYIHP